jgi:hypothetical protein
MDDDGPVAFESFRMTTETTISQRVSTKDGLVAFFDILGYKNLLLANSVEASLNIIDTAMLRALDGTEDGFKSIIGDKPFDLETFVISDSILVALPAAGASNQVARSRGTLFFIIFCAQLMTDLLQKGLPPRGAIASGVYAVRSEKNRVAFVGQPILDAHALAGSLELAGCAIVPSFESKALFGADLHFMQVYKTPIKNQASCELRLLRYSFMDFDKEHSTSRQKIVGYFEAHKKRLDSSSLRKLNNTIQFLKNCNQLPPDD